MIMRAGRRRSRRTQSLLIFSLLPLVSLSSFHPQDNYLLTFTTNSNSNSSSPLLSSNPNSTHKIPLNSTPHISSHPFSFSFPISSPAGPHLLRLHFFPLPAGPTSATFNVSASSFPLLTNFSPLPPPPQEEAALEAAEFFFFSLDLPSLTLSFTPAAFPPQKLAFVDAVELYSVPADLILGTALLARDGGAADVSGHVLEVVHRVNVGGPRVTPENDTLWRNWVEDDGFLVGGRRGKTVRFSERLNYRQGGATRETAPESVYGTCREIDWRGMQLVTLVSLVFVLGLRFID